MMSWQSDVVKQESASVILLFLLILRFVHAVFIISDVHLVE